MARNANEVRKLSDLPEWFDISKYKDATTLNHVGWYENLFIRSDYLLLLDEPKFSMFAEPYPEIIEQVISDLGELRHTPIWENSGQVRRRLLLFTRAKLIFADAGVRQMTIDDIYLAEENIAETLENYTQMKNNEGNFLQIEYDAMQRIQQDKEGKNPSDDLLPSGFIKVNLNLPEHILVDQFKTLLKKLNLEMKKVQKLEFDKWIKFGVLPYLDLKIWERESGKTIINRVMADALFPLGEGGEEVIRKTTAKLADELLTRAHLDKLAEIAGAI